MSEAHPEVAVTRVYRFSAAHHYYDEALSPAENERRFGKCANRNGHGHNYRLEVTLRGRMAASQGMLVDLRELDGLVSRTLLEPLDHRNLNLEVPFFATHLPTCENMALFAWQQLQPLPWPHARLARVRLFESDDLSAECS